MLTEIQKGLTGVTPQNPLVGHQARELALEASRQHRTADAAVRSRRDDGAPRSEAISAGASAVGRHSRRPEVCASRLTPR